MTNYVLVCCAIMTLSIRTLAYMSMSTGAVPSALKSCLTREYGSFFKPMECEFYNNDVEFVDPLTKFQGIDKYKNNVDMLAGRTSLGSILFKDAAIRLHDVTALDDGRIQTRWTLRVTVKFLPWQPTPRFSGVSIYTLDAETGKIAKQEDYWDSINLSQGRYSSVSLMDGLGDFLGQLKQDNSAEMVAPELPYELLRRGQEYEVRRYPAHIVAETTYDKRPEGYDRIGNYVQGSNDRDERITYYSPTVMSIGNCEETGQRLKRMTWPLAFAAPGGTLPPLDSFPTPAVSRIKLKEMPSVVWAVLRFEVPATEPVVRGFTSNLIKFTTEDGLTPSTDASNGVCNIGQYDALFSLNKRRNEVWIQLDDHPWKG